MSSASSRARVAISISDGPAGYEWIFPNRIPAERESRMYVGLRKETLPSAWARNPGGLVLPSTTAKYEPSPCASVVDVLANVGLTTVEGLEVVAATWRTFEPQSQTASAELHERVQKMWQELEAKGLCEDGLSATGSPSQLPLPMADFHFGLSVAQPGEISSRTFERKENRRSNGDRATTKGRRSQTRSEAFVAYADDRIEELRRPESKRSGIPARPSIIAEEPGRNHLKASRGELGDTIRRVLRGSW